MSKEIFFGDDEFIISKTDIKGVITYGNELFRKMSGYSEEEYIGQPHNILRHPEMPASIFKLLWETVSNKKEIFALVNNKAKNGDYYWVMAHVTPSYGENEKIIGYHSVRRRPSETALRVMQPLYKTLCNIEKASGIAAGMQKIEEILNVEGVTYEKFILSLKSDISILHQL